MPQPQRDAEKLSLPARRPRAGWLLPYLPRLLLSPPPLGRSFASHPLPFCRRKRRKSFGHLRLPATAAQLPHYPGYGVVVYLVGSHSIHNREHLLLFTDAKQAGYSSDAAKRFYQDLTSRLQAIPGVRAASASNFALVSGGMSGYGNVYAVNMGQGSSPIYKSLF